MAKRGKVPVSTRAIIQRINRKLAKDGDKLRKNRSQRWWPEMGDYYIVDEERNAFIRGHVDLEDLGRELGVLEDWETVEKS